ncbi:hypothetical protein H696_04904 [Fonticula alba]|uniref:START domain-containing protein n=1 Tax=Fonticula alba TaxID=691883 RepID=A0A058Z3A8_FONAL|nr:hypothetical protein H696_04904 [Fonticula alba]KCV68611.1 hypothetical protein H696_04904 [Fonticula alba]|eukprot:XP_009497043.1 hypothetical protein H696_04904 [Fonticula alba]
MAGRYFVSARIILPAGQGNASTVNADDKTSVMALTAVDGPVPSTIDTSGLVRGTQHDVGCVLVKTSDTSARVYWFVQTTLGGWMMIDVTKMTARSVHRLLLQLKQFAATLKK